MTGQERGSQFPPPSPGNQRRILLASPDASLADFNQTPIGSPVAPQLLNAELVRLGYVVHWWSPQAHGLTQIAGNVRTLLRQVRQTDADVVHLFLLTPSLAWIAGLLVRNAETPLLVTFSTHCHSGWRWLRKHNGFRSRQVRWHLFKYVAYHPAWTGLARRLPQAGAYSVASQYQARQLEELHFPADRLHVIPNMSDLESGSEPQPGQRPSCQVGFMGHFTPSKGIDSLLQAFDIVALSRDDAELRIAWSGRGNDAFVRSAIASSPFARRIELLGRVDRRQFLNGLTVLVQPYRHLLGTQIYPNTLLEAMALGVPLVTTEVPPLPELLGDGAAVLVPPEDPDALAQAILALCANEDLRNQQQFVQSQVARRSSVSRVADAYHGLYQTLIR